MSKPLPLLVCSTAANQAVTAEEAVELAAAFKALGDPVRLRLLSLIAAHEGGEACVCDISGAFELTGPTISHHLKVLRTAGLVTSERRGTWVYYRARPDVIARLADVLVPLGTPLASTCAPDDSELPA
ncbi:metalloregulator ArsR/SmtB family transcription factor [Pseudonocardia kujensis]|uniref:ArsR/SmtB family transcription factor n=1 Tax=Pseudonocardia kujensis TaxID=1128675 RepID=UPI001E43A4DB|nr:metalloregulator ArsR/SmtB family transcription factor [Pseudonocardia kujensis]MCE0764398.1 metalloregulator ArsR/SmtB family transcription factor [Pseudonocardia kujensis]